MKTNIAFIGFMGAGKTTVAKNVSARMNHDFIELDSIIEKKAKKTISDIFSQDGEIHFRELEIEATKEICRLENVVIACGGGIILNQINIDRLKQGSVIVYLSANLDKLIKRVIGTQTVRPLLDVENMKKHICALLEFRVPLYERAADITVDTTEMNIAATVEKVMKEIHNNDRFSF